MRSISDSKVTRPAVAAVLVDDERFARAPAPHFGQKIVRAQRDRHREHSPRQRPAFAFGSPGASALKRSFTCSMPTHVVEIAAVDRQPRMRTLGDLSRRGRAAMFSAATATSSVRGS